MLTLRLTQFTEAEDKYRVEVTMEGDGLPQQTAISRFDFKLTPQDHEDLRWYLEDYLQYPLDPAPKIAARIEKRMAEVGAELFKAVFQANDDARDLWATFRDKLDDSRVEIITGVAEATAIPWELLRDPKTEAALALRAQAFVRSQPQAAQRPQLPDKNSGPIRILLVICRPAGREDVPFRSVASFLIKGLSASAAQAFQLDVLRPPTFEQLSKTLRSAKAGGKPYHVVHFDGHGDFFDMENLFANWKDKTEEEIMQLLAALVNFDPNRFSPRAIYPQTPRERRRGYLAFENPGSVHSLRFVDGQELGKLLAETDVPVLMLNACRSAYAEAPTAPLPTEADPHTQVRAFGSFTQEIMDAGAAGVVAMRYTVYVVTAAQFVADLYAALTQGYSLGEAVTLGRKQLAADPNRSIAYDPRPLQDWPVPVVYEAASIKLFPKPKQAKKLSITLKAGEATAPHARSNLDASLPPQPDAGFFGRDETLLALDRAFDTQAIVLLHAFAGSGKTATAAEFSRWYSLTGGMEGPVLFTSFEQYLPLARVLDKIGLVFGATLENAGVHWLALLDEAQREVALQVMQQIPLLWIWDNVEPVAGFPAGTKSAWSAAEQKDLADFLRAARGTKAKFLLTSRRDEQAWLGDLPARITVPAMPMQERVQLARALAEKHGHRLTEVQDWRPLLQLTQGNPLTITVLVGQALRDGLKTKKQIEDFVTKLRAGEAAFADEASEGRAKSLSASLSYGFEHAFTKTERKQLALLHFFQGFVDVDVLQWMGDPKIGNLPEVRGFTREAGISLLDRAAEIGLLSGHHDGYYSIHPAVPWYFKNLFDRYYPASSSKDQASSIQATRTYVEAIGQLGDYYHHEYNNGNREVIDALTAEEANLQDAWRLARKNGWWRSVMHVMQGLRALYNHTSRMAEWRRIVEEIVPDFVDQATDGALLEREEHWGIFTQYRVALAKETRQWAEAERLQRLIVEWARQQAAAALAVPMESLDNSQRNAIRTLGVSLTQLAEILREQNKVDCLALFQEATALFQRIGDHVTEAITAFDLGIAYKELLAIRDLDKAERWYRRSLELYEERDGLGRAKCLYQIGQIYSLRLREARKANKPKPELVQNFNSAIKFYQKAMEVLPTNAMHDLAVTQVNLGSTYAEMYNFEMALTHYREAIRYYEAAGDLYASAQTRFNIAVVLMNVDRLTDAREYSLAALRNFETYGDHAVEDIQETQRLIAAIEQEMSKCKT